MQYLPEHLRISFSRLRLGSHRLRIETGRWSRLPREDRKCPCGGVQDECHAVLECPLTSDLRTDMEGTNLAEYFNNNDPERICAHTFLVLMTLDSLNSTNTRTAQNA